MMFFRGILLCTYIILLYISTFFKLGHRVFIKKRKIEWRRRRKKKGDRKTKKRDELVNEIENKHRNKWCLHFFHSTQFKLFVYSCKAEEKREREWVKVREREREKARQRNSKKESNTNDDKEANAVSRVMREVSIKDKKKKQWIKRTKKISEAIWFDWMLSESAFCDVFRISCSFSSLKGTDCFRLTILCHFHLL